MRRLIARIYRVFFGLRIQAADLHLADLETERANLLLARAALEQDLERNARQHTAALATRAAMAARRESRP